MLAHAASTLPVLSFRYPLRSANKANGAFKYSNRVQHLTLRRRESNTKSFVTTRKRSLKIVVSSENSSFSLENDVEPSSRRDLEVELNVEKHYHVSSDGGRLELGKSFVDGSRRLVRGQGPFEIGTCTGDYAGVHAFSLEQKETREALQERHFREVGIKYGRLSSGKTDNDHEAEEDGDVQSSRDVDFRALVSAMGLIMGTAVGPGILGLPAATLPAGIQASTLMVIGAWAYVTCSILLVAEISCAVMTERGEKEVSFTGLVEHTLGHYGARMVAMVFASLNYALLVACVAGLGSILHGWLQGPAGLWCAASAVAVGGLVALAPFRVLDGFNRALCGLMLAAITSLVAIGMCAGKEATASSGFIASFSISSVLSAMPLTVLTLGFHVITPVICKVMKGKPQEARKAILLGGAVPLAMVLAWNGVVLSLAGAHRSSALDPIKLLLSLNRSAAPAVQAFAFAALGTTLIGYAVSFPKQLADTAQIFRRAPLEDCKVNADGDEEVFAEIRPLLWALCPPTLAAILWPTAFASALDFAGVYANCFLFGILPPLMAWRHRYHQKREVSSSKDQLLVPGGRLLLIVLFGISIFLGISPRT